MLASVPTTSKSSTWLHRLRASRGFPESDHIDLDHFLSTSRDQIDPTDSGKSPPPEVTDYCDDNGVVQGRDSIANVLSELFHMGEFEGKTRLKRKKSCRKQNCPKICVVSTDLDVQNVAARKDSSSRHEVKEGDRLTERVEEEEDWDLSAAYSQTEVTVIDTSVPCWKFEKMLYRSKNVWRIGDKKGKGLMSGDRKKRQNENGGDVQKKKLKKKLKLCNSSKCADKEGSMLLSKFNQGHSQCKLLAANEKKRDKCGQAQEKSFCKKQIDEGSSVVLIKSIPTTNKKNVSGVSNNYVKSMHR